MQVRYHGDEVATIAADADGGSSSSELLITLTTGSNSITLGANSADSPDTEVATIDRLIHEINKAGEDRDGNHFGWEARRKDCLGAHSLDSAQFIDTSETEIATNWTDFLQQDMSAVAGAFASGLGLTAKRFVNYDFARRNGNTGIWEQPEGLIELGWLDVTVTFSADAPSVYILDDDGNILWDSGDLTTATQKTASGVFSIENPLQLRGPVLAGIHCPAVLDGITAARFTWRMLQR